MSDFMQEIRYARRVLAKTPGTTIVAVLSLAFGIGANTATFSMINALILRSLHVRSPQELIELSLSSPGSRTGKELLSYPMFEELRKGQRVFTSMFAYSAGAMTNFEASGVRYAAVLTMVSGDYFTTLGIQPFLGRLIAQQDTGEEPGKAPSRVAVLDYRCWKRRYNSDPEVVGKVISIDGKPVTIIGVTPKSFWGMTIDAATDATVPIGYTGTSAFRQRKNLWLYVVGRLRPGVTSERARAQVSTLWPHAQEITVPEEYQGGAEESILCSHNQRLLCCEGKVLHAGASLTSPHDVDDAGWPCASNGVCKPCQHHVGPCCVASA